MNAQGELLPLEIQVDQAPCLGLTYRSHVGETYGGMPAGLSPEFFFKRVVDPLSGTGDLRSPSRSDLLAMIRTMDPALSARIDRTIPHLPSMLDYEVELGLMMLDDVTRTDLQQPDFCPRLGYFLANDATARSIQVLGEGQARRLDFWSAAKSFAGFLALGEQMWVPRHPTPDGRVDFLLTATVNGEIRQQCRTVELLYTPRQLLERVLAASNSDRLAKGTCILTGTPGGIALSVAPWQRRLAGLLPGRLTRLRLAIGAATRNRKFLKPGDRLTLSGDALGTISCTIT